MANPNKKKLAFTTTLFWVLLIYIIAALVWWFFSLMQQNQEMYELKKKELIQIVPKSSPNYQKELFKIEDQRRRNNIKYVGEGFIFLLLIIVGAAFIYRSVRRQLSLQQQQQNFVMAVTHELKTPISVARLNLETLKRYQLDAQKQQKLINTSLQETLRLDMLINNILISSQLDDKIYQPSKEKLDFSSLINDEVKQFANRYPDRTLNLSIIPGIALTGDELLLKLLVSNLLENANKYSGKTKPIGCTLKKNVNTVILQVKDEGSGIPDEEKERIFEKFYRIGNEETRTAKGTGLGLYICKKIANAHHASIYVMNNVPQGSNFIVEFSV